MQSLRCWLKSWYGPRVILWVEERQMFWQGVELSTWSEAVEFWRIYGWTVRAARVPTATGLRIRLQADNADPDRLGDIRPALNMPQSLSCWVISHSTQILIYFLFPWYWLTGVFFRRWIPPAGNWCYVIKFTGRWVDQTGRSFHNGSA